MELAFTTITLRQLCESEAKANKELGTEIADKLRRRLADLRAATYVNDVIVGNPHESEHSNTQHFSVDLCNGYSIIFCANHNSNPVLAHGNIDWSNVSRIKIVKIGNNND